MSETRGEHGAGLSGLVAANARAERARRQERQADVAERVGMSRATYAALEAGDRRITLDDALRLCRALEVDLRALLAGEDGAAAREVLGLRRREGV